MTRAWILVVLISATLVNARWDITVGVQHTVELLSSEEAVEVVADVPLGNGIADALGYDSIKNQLYYEDTEDGQTSIFRVILSGNNFRRQPIVTYQGVRGIAVDPISSILYWTSDNSIKWLNVSEEITTPQEGNTLISFDKDLPHGIAVDVCNRLLYWTNKYDSKPSIERSDLMGRNRTVLVDKVDRPIGLFVDQLTSRLYWTEEQTSGIRHRVESADFHGQHRKVHAELNYLPLSVVVVQNKIYWLESFSRKALFSIDILLNESSSSKAEPKLLKSFRSTPFGIITSQQDSNLASKECKVIADKKKQIEEERKSKLGHLVEHFDNKELLSKFDFCLNYGTLVAEKGECLCPEGYEGARCETNVCHNFCVEGECRILGGAPRCHCPPHRTGHRCQVERCDGYCLNGGTCSLDDSNSLQCECPAHYTGNRCQQKLPDMSSNKMCVIYCHMQQISHEYQQLLLDTENLAPIFSKRPELCSCPEPKTEKAENCTGNSVTIEEISPDQCSTDIFESSAANMLYILICACCILLLMVMFLAVKAWNLHKRPRIKKRIIVNKQPLTCRPQTENEQCEITIENCCNMNICETPCFEPEFRKPSGKDSNKKEEKRNLLGGIELPPDDLY
ncbi:hypothetical protein LSTR_LSTR001041 [Laodelphax striatellus]|uniref:Protein cueball n=1 Tax=Laodelphax striatellus TaxID=195883 RepID=A0A482X2B5_LAOST|nr:hypothetical protein LSTR_LSTR001041 [Laodelphax striatellus]